MKEKITEFAAKIKSASTKEKLILKCVCCAVVAVVLLSGVFFLPNLVKNSDIVETGTSSSSSSSESDSSSAEETDRLSAETDKTVKEEKTEEKNVPRFPQGTVIHETDVSDMTAEEAKAALDAWAQDYSLTLTVNNTTRSYSASSFDIAFKELDLEALIEECEKDETKRQIAVDSPVAYSTSLVDSALDSFPGANTPAKNARLSYDASSGAFVLLKEETGSRLQLSAVRESIIHAIANRISSVTETAEKEELKPEISTDSTKAQSALTAANDLLNVQLTYTYSPDDKHSSTETIGKKQIANWLVVNSDGLSVSISSSGLNSYCSSMSDAHSVSGKNSGFQATGNYTVDMSVPSGGQYVDTDALYDDIEYCILNGVSGSRTAPYISTGGTDLSFGGTYIEINLSAQFMWLYQNGTCVVATPIVSGCVNWGCATPTGVYAVQTRVRYATLYGEDYVQPVDYWLGFNGGIGIHDSQWRTSGYGGTIYEYDGSHGCINTPLDAVSAIFEKVTVGTPVIVYGGSTTVPSISQVVTGTSSYTVKTGSAAFKLDAKPKYKVGLTYSSSNPAVATVSANGTVTPKGVGTTVITVQSGELAGYTQASLKVTVKVKADCGNQHSWDKGVETKAPTCTADGVKTFTCSVCKTTKTKAISATGHTWNEGVETKAPTCIQEGVKTYTCTASNCGKTKTEKISVKTEHTWGEGVETKAPTCTQDGVMTSTCTVPNCGKTKTEAIEAKGHTWNEGEETSAPTCTQDGVMTKTCTVPDCGETKTETISASGHSYVDGVCETCGEPEPATATQ